MGARQVVAIGIAAVAGTALVRAGTYDLVTHLVFGRRYDEIARAIAAEAPEGGTVVDLGCGTGEVLGRLAALAPSLDLTGVDIDAEMIERAQRNAGRRSVGAATGRPRFVVADAAKLPFADESVDLVVSSYAVHHFPDRHGARSEIMRVLKPGGRALIWDVVSPHGKREAPDGPPSPSATDGHGPHGNSTPDRHGMSALAMLQMLFRFSRLPAERYELRKAMSTRISREIGR